MPFQPGNPGRPKGSRNKRSAMVEIIAQKFSADPFEILMMIASGDWKGLGYDSEVYVMENAQGGTKIGYTISPEMRLSAAKECCQYLHAKRKEQPEEDEAIEVNTIEEKRNLLEKAQREINLLKEELGLLNEPEGKT